MTEITFRTYWQVFQKRKKQLAFFTAFSALVMAGAVLSTPRVYTARVTTFPPSNAGSISKLTEILSSFAGGSPTAVESLSYLIQSRRMGEAIVDHFKLEEKFQRTRESAVRKAQRMVDGYDLSKGVLFIIEATTPTLIFPRISRIFARKI